jgi:hypothetical protein
MRLLSPGVDRSIPAIASRSIPAIAIALCACSCNPSVHLFKPHQQPLPDTTQCAILDHNDQPPINGDSIGVLSLWNDGVRGSVDDESQQTLQSTALRTGANLVKITGYVTYVRRGLSYEEINAILYKVNDIQNYEKVIAWNGYRQLTFADFKGRRDPASPSSIGSHSQCGIWGPEARFNCLTSWIDPRRVDADRLLIHEQGNFDLAECYNLQFRRLLHYHFLRLPKSNLRAAERILAAYDAKRAEYDSVTRDGLDVARQSEWTDKIAHALADRTDTSFLVPPPSGTALKDSVAKSLTPPPGKALVYIIRPNRFTSSLPKRMLLNIFFVYPCPYLLFINAVRYQVDYAAAMTTDRIPAHRYVGLLLDPGERTFAPWATLGNWTYDSPDLDLLLAPGRTYYLRLDMPSRWFAFHARPRLVLISEKEGLTLFRKCRVARHEEN